MFIYIVIVNAINLIDGVDGLAAGTGMIASITFAYWFFKTGDLPLALLAVGLAGSLLGFLIFNWQPAKIATLYFGPLGSPSESLYSVINIAYKPACFINLRDERAGFWFKKKCLRSDVVANYDPLSRFSLRSIRPATACMR